MTSHTHKRRWTATVSIVASCALALTAGCSGGSGATGGSPKPSAATISQADIDKAMNTPTTLTFWTWVPNITDEVNLFMKKYPNIKVEVVNVGQGAPHYQKLRAAIKSGKGAPDVAQVEFQYLPSFTIGGDLLDLTPYLADDAKGRYPEWVWGQVATSSGIYGVPQDSGPMGLVYRTDLLKNAGIDVPKTWDDFAAASKTYHEKNATAYLAGLPGNDPGQVMGLMWQAGARPFSYDGAKTVGIDVTSPEATKVWTYWTDLIASGAVSVDADFTDQWYQGLAGGKYASWLTAAWGPVFLQGTAAKTSGKWAAAPLPQWSASENVSGNWGGSSDAVLASTKNPIAAAELAKWINTDHESALMLANEQFLFPVSHEILSDPAFVDQKSEFYGGQQVNKEFKEISATVDTGFQWVPFMDYVYSSFNDTMGKAISDKTDLNAAAKTWQDQLVNYAKQQGFTVK